MKTKINFLTMLMLITISTQAQYIAIDTSHWLIQAQSYVIENYQGKESIYLQGGSMALKDTEFKNGTIEFKIWLKEEQSFPGVYFRYDQSTNNAEEFYVRPHLSGKPDANQAVPMNRGISPWQLYFGPKYSFPYHYKYDDWTHIKIVVNEDKAQVFLDGSEKPNLSWMLHHEAKAGNIIMRGGNMSGMHISDIRVAQNETTLIDFEPGHNKPIANAIQTWEISDKFQEKALDDIEPLHGLIKARKWNGSLTLAEGVAANISELVTLRDGSNKNTVFAKVIIESDRKQTKRLEFGYSDRVVAILNGSPIYRGNNRWRSRDYRYLGTIGLFDEIYLDLKKGSNELLMAVSEDFGGWLITGRIKDQDGISIK